MKRACGIFGIRHGLASAAVLAFVISVFPSLGVHGAEAELISNGDMEEIDGNRPRGWGGDMYEEGGNHFLRLVQTTPGEMPMVYRRIDLPKDISAYDQIDLSMRGRVTGLVKGEQSWYDARVMINVKSADGATLSSPYINFGKDTGWTEKHTYIRLSPKAAYIELMPTLFRCAAGTFDFDDFHAVFREPTIGLVAPTTEGLGAADMLHVASNRLVNVAGKHVWLQGVNVPSMEWSVKGENMTTSFDEAIVNWGASIIRLPLKSKYWFGSDASDGGVAYRQRVDNLINQANGQGCYVLVDLHEYEKVTEDHVAFWRSCAKRYANRPGVLFDLLNEPHDTTWEVWHDGMQSLIDTVREAGAKNVVVCGGLDWGYDLSGVLKGYALSDTEGNGIMYSAHVYPWKSGRQTKVLDIAKLHPILLGEVGCQVEPMSFETTAKDPYEWAPEVLADIAEYKLNWTAWCLHPKSSPCAISDWNYTPTPYWGAFVKEALLAAKANNPVEDDDDSGSGQEPDPEQGTDPDPEQGTDPDPEQGTDPDPEQGPDPEPEVVDATHYVWNPDVEEGDWSDPKNWIPEKANVANPTYPNSAKCHAYFRNLTKPVRVRITEAFQVDYLCAYKGVEVTLYRDPKLDEVQLTIWGTWWDQSENAKFTVDGNIYYPNRHNSGFAKGAYVRFTNGATYDTTKETQLHGDGAMIEVSNGATWKQSDWTLSMRGKGTRFILDDARFYSKEVIYLARNTDSSDNVIEVRGKTPVFDCPGVIAGRDGMPDGSPRIVFSIPEGGYAKAPFSRANGGSFLASNDKNTGLLTDVVIDPDSPFLAAGTVSEARLVDYPKGAVYGSNISTVGRFVSSDKVLRCTDRLLCLCTEMSVPVSGFCMKDGSVFVITVDGAVKGARYQVMRTFSLAEPFQPLGEPFTASDGGSCELEVASGDAPSAFFKVVAVE